ncbi:hypothetical protein [Alcaligenes sp. WGS1538]|uniref:hypothetical protein n=1 Tax=Alcaligenes sp. WGS1538 TaxID=3366811 RepID=UPI00372D465B
MNDTIGSVSRARLKRAAALMMLCGLLAACDGGGSTGSVPENPGQPGNPETTPVPETPKQLKCAP